MLRGKSVLVSRTQSDGANVWPVSVADVKANAQIDHDGDDLLLLSADGADGIIPAAVEYVEDRGRVALVNQTRRLYLSGSEFRAEREIELPLPPLVSVSSITYLDGDYAEQTVDAATYRALPGANAVRLKVNETWPEPVLDESAAWVEYVCGYGETAADVPPRWKRPIISLATYWWNHRDGFAGRELDASFAKGLDRVIETAGGKARYV